MQNILLVIILVAGLVAGFAVGSYSGNKCRKELADLRHTNEETVKILNSSIEERDRKIKEINSIYNSTKNELEKRLAEKEVEWAETRKDLSSLTSALKAQLTALKDKHPALMKKLQVSTGDEKLQIEKSISFLLNEINRLNLEIESKECLQKHVPDEILNIFK